MSNDILKNAYEKVDNLLKSLRDNGSGSLYDLGELYDTEGQMAQNLLVEHNLISFQKGYFSTDSVIDITTLGINVLIAGGIEMYLASLNESTKEKENLELQKLRSENMLIANQLVDYEKTKGYLKNTTIATIVLSIIAVIELIIILTKPK